MDRHEPQRLAVGDECALLLGVSLYDVTISEVRVILEGDPAEFAMYRVKSRESSCWFESTSQHRSDLFKLPSERERLIQQLDSDMNALHDLIRDQEMEHEREEQAAEEIPHGYDCECEACQMERARDTAEEPSR